jgi:hypothetical protein
VTGACYGVVPVVPVAGAAVFGREAGAPVVSEALDPGAVLLRFFRLVLRLDDPVDPLLEPPELDEPTLVEPVAGSFTPEPVLPESKISGSVFPRPALPEPGVPGTPPGPVLPGPLGLLLPDPGIPGPLFPGAVLPGPAPPGDVLPGPGFPGLVLPGPLFPGATLPAPAAWEKTG